MKDNDEGNMLVYHEEIRIAICQTEFEALQKVKLVNIIDIEPYLLDISV